MCGTIRITGQYPFRDISLLNELQIHHRPGDSGDLLHQGSNFTIQLVMRRLAFVSEHGDCQPSIRKDVKLVLVFYGQVFNASQLRTKLKSVSKLHFESSDSETEV